MKATTNKAAGGSSVYAWLDTIRLSDADRRNAYFSLRNGERIAEVMLRAADLLRGIARCAEHAAASLASSIKAMLAKPVKH